MSAWIIVNVVGILLAIGLNIVAERWRPMLRRRDASDWIILAIFVVLWPLTVGTVLFGFIHGLILLRRRRRWLRKHFPNLGDL